MESLKVNIRIEIFDLDEEQRERMWTTSNKQYQASIDSNTPKHETLYVKGCPMGRDFRTESGAILDLVSRVEMESKIKLEVGKIFVDDRRRAHR